jgi:hypothetical protein
MSKELIEQLAKEHLTIVRTFEKWVATGSPNRFGAVSGEYRTIFTIDATAEQLEAFAKAYQAAAHIDNVAMVDRGALMMVIQALRRDAAQGQVIRGEMADALIPTQAKG